MMAAMSVANKQHANMVQRSSMTATFTDRLSKAIQARQTPVLVGLDPRLESLPEKLLQGIAADDLEQIASVFEVFCRDVIDVVAPLVPAVKPQAAFFEQVGPAGLAALARVIAYARAHDLLVIMDAKRGDIGSTAEAYAQAYLGPSDSRPLAGDALTVNPYLGEDTLTPFVDLARERGAGVFVLVKTSNPGSGQLQDLEAGGKTVYRRVAEHVEQLATRTSAGSQYGAVGAVVGATHRRQLDELRGVMPHAWFLVPGYGSQGATARDVAPAFDEAGLGAIINNSRGIIFAHARPPYAERFGQARWQEAVEAATSDMIRQLRAETRAGNLAASV